MHHHPPPNPSPLQRVASPSGTSAGKASSFVRALSITRTPRPGSGGGGGGSAADMGGGAAAGSSAGTPAALRGRAAGVGGGRLQVMSPREVGDDQV